VPQFLANDQYHLSKDGIAVLASNIRTTVDGILSINHTKSSALGVANESTTLVLDIDSCIFVIIFSMALIQLGADSFKSLVSECRTKTLDASLISFTVFSVSANVIASKMILYIHTNSIIIKTTMLETGHNYCILFKTTLVKMLESGDRYNIKVWKLMNQRPHRINLKYSTDFRRLSTTAEFEF
jgi:hypothetical protein